MRKRIALRYVPDALSESQLSDRVARITSFSLLRAYQPPVDLHVHVGAGGDVSCRLANTTSVRLVDYRDEPGGEVLAPLPRDEKFVTLQDWAGLLRCCVVQFDCFYDTYGDHPVNVLLTSERGSSAQLLAKVMALLHSGRSATVRVHTVRSD